MKQLGRQQAWIDKDSYAKVQELARKRGRRITAELNRILKEKLEDEF